MAQCFVSGKETVVFQYVRFCEEGENGRVAFCRFDALDRAHQELPEDWAEPITLKWNPGRDSDKLGLEEHRRLADEPRMRALPGMVRASVPRDRLRAKLAQFAEARERLLNP